MRWVIFVVDELFFKISNIGKKYPLWLLLHLLFDLLAENGNKDAPIGDYFEFIHALHLLPVVFRDSFLLRIIAEPLAFQAAHTYNPSKNCRQMPSAATSSEVFCVRIIDTIGNLINKKTASRKKMSIKFYIRQWTFVNVRTNRMVTLCQKKPCAIL